MNYKTCCAQFENALSIKGNDGLSIVPVDNSMFGKTYPEYAHVFFLEFCAIPKSQFGKVELAKDHKVILSSRHAIKFCPFCGVKLAKFYRTTFTQLPHLTEGEWSASLQAAGGDGIP